MFFLPPVVPTSQPQEREVMRQPEASIMSLQARPYQSTHHKVLKASIVEEIWATVHRAGGRFVRRKGTDWVEMSAPACRKRVGLASQTFGEKM